MSARSSLATLVLPALGALRLVGAVAVEFAVIWRFGVSAETDAYFMTVAIPWLVSRAAAASAPVALVPVLRGAQERGQSTLKGVVLLAGVTAGLACALILGTLRASTSINPGLSFGALAVTLAVAHSIATGGELVRPYLIATNHATRAMLSDAVQAIVAIGGVVQLSRASGVIAVAFVVATSYLAQLLVLVIFAIRSNDRAAESSLPLRDLARAARRSFLLTFGATAARRVTVPVERQFAASVGVGRATSVAYAGQITNAAAAVLGIYTTNSLLPFLSSRASKQERELVLSAYLVWLAEIGAAVALGTASAVGWILLFSSSEAVHPFRPMLLATGVTILALPGMLLVQALLCVHYSRGDGATPSRHLMITLGVHLACLTAVRSSLGVVGIALCWVVTGAYSLARATRITREALDGPVLGRAQRRRLAISLPAIVAASASAAAIGGAVAGWLGAALVCTGVASTIVLTRRRPHLVSGTHQRGEVRG